MINILDIVVISLTVLLLLFGLWRGMYKMIFGLVSSILALVLAVALINPAVSFTVDKTTVDETLVTIIGEPLSAQIPNASQKLGFYDIDGDAETEDQLGYEVVTVGEDGNTLYEYKEFKTLLDGSVYSYFGGIIESFVKDKVTEETAVAPEDGGETTVVFISALVSTLVAYILAVAWFIVLWIFSFIIIKLLFLLLKKIVNATYIGYFLNRLLGGVVGAAISLVLVFLFLTIIQLMGTYDAVVPINQMIEQSTITKLLANNNFLFGYITNLVDLQSLIDKIMGTINGAVNTAAAGAEEATEAAEFIGRIISSKVIL